MEQLGLSGPRPVVEQEVAHMEKRLESARESLATAEDAFQGANADFLEASSLVEKAVAKQTRTA